MENLDITLSRTSAREDVGEAKQCTLVGVLASLENIVSVTHERHTAGGIVTVNEGNGWTRIYNVRYGTDAAIMGAVSRVRHCRTGKVQA